MKVLLLHKNYRTFAPSGEDFAVANERRMLDGRGVEVITLLRCNDDLNDSSLTAKTAIAINTICRKFKAGDPQDLEDGVRAMLSDPAGLRQMRAAARAYFDTHLTEEHNFSLLMRIYADAIAEVHPLAHDDEIRGRPDGI